MHFGVAAVLSMYLLRAFIKVEIASTKVEQAVPSQTRRASKAGTSPWDRVLTDNSLRDKRKSGMADAKSARHFVSPV